MREVPSYLDALSLPSLYSFCVLRYASRPWFPHAGDGGGGAGGGLYSSSPAVILRFLTGASLSLVYPPSLKVSLDVSKRDTYGDDGQSRRGERICSPSLRMPAVIVMHHRDAFVWLLAGLLDVGVDVGSAGVEQS